MISLEQKTQINWTFRLLTFISWAYAALGVFCGLVLIQPPQGVSTAAVLFIAVLCLTLAVLAYKTKENLLWGKKSGWTGAVIFSSICLASLLLPFAILSLRQLFKSEVQSQFNQKPEAGIIDPISAPYFSTTAKIGLIFTLASCVGLYYFTRPDSTYRVNPKLTAEELVNLGRSCNTKNNWICSEATYARLLELLPNNTTALANLAVAKSQLDKHEEALPLYAQYFAAGQGAIDIMFYYGQSLEAVGKSDEALTWYQRTLNTEPNLIDVTESTVKLLVQKKQFQEALSVISRLVRINPKLKDYFSGHQDVIKSQMNEASR